MSEPMMYILHLEDDPLDSELAQEQLRGSGMTVEVDRIDTLEQVRIALQSRPYALMLSDYTVPGTDPLEALRLVRQLRPELPVIFLSGTIGEERAAETLRLGANDYVLKQRMDRLPTTVRRALAEAQELTRRKQAEAALRHSEERLRLAQEVGKIGSFEWNIPLGRLEWSPQLEGLYGLAPGSFDNTLDGWRRLVHPEDREQADSRVQQALETGTLDAQWRALWSDGTVRWLAARAQVFRDELGKPLRMLGVNTDITEPKRAEESLRAAKFSAEQAKEVAEEASRAKDRFIAILSHELRTPLTAVLPALDALREVAPPAAMEYVEIASRNVELEARLIDDLLDITRIARGKIELQCQAIDLCDIMQRATQVCMADIEARGVHFALRVEDPPHMVHADPIRLEQIFWNLIQNAVKFTPPGGCVGVRVRRIDGHSVTEVHDSGAGIESDALSRIFNSFEQETRSITRQFGGLGLGLAISKALAEMHGGTIRVRSDGKGKGAVFITEVPLAAVLPAASDPRPSAARPARPEPLRILLVEDHEDTARILSLLLRKAGHEVRRAADLASAKRLADMESFDVLLSDLGLPDGSGHDLMRYLVDSGRHLPAIALSGYGTAADIQRSLAAGFLEHVVKPVSFAVLEAALARIRGHADIAKGHR